MTVRKHQGINQKTGKLKRGYKYTGKKLKSGLPQIAKIQKGGGKITDAIKGYIEFDKKDSKSYPEENKIFRSFIKKIQLKDNREIDFLSTLMEYQRKELLVFHNVYIEDKKTGKFKKLKVFSKNDILKNVLFSNEKVIEDVLKFKINNNINIDKYKIIGKKNNLYVFGLK